MSSPPLHPDAAPLRFLIGTWSGTGRGDYPTIEAFSYQEEVRFSSTGKPFLLYTQRTWDPLDERPLHAEIGYLRPVGEGRLELVLAQPTGIVEIHDGVVDGRQIEFRSRLVGLTPTAKQVDEVTRTLRVSDDVLSYRVDMAAVGQELQWHLSAELRRADN